MFLVRSLRVLCAFRWNKWPNRLNMASAIELLHVETSAATWLWAVETHSWLSFCPVVSLTLHRNWKNSLKSLDNQLVHGWIGSKLMSMMLVIIASQPAASQQRSDLNSVSSPWRKKSKIAIMNHREWYMSISNSHYLAILTELLMLNITILILHSGSQPWGRTAEPATSYSCSWLISWFHLCLLQFFITLQWFH